MRREHKELLSKALKAAYEKEISIQEIKNRMTDDLNIAEAALAPFEDGNLFWPTDVDIAYDDNLINVTIRCEITGDAETLTYHMDKMEAYEQALPTFMGQILNLYGSIDGEKCDAILASGVSEEFKSTLSSTLQSQNMATKLENELRDLLNEINTNVSLRLASVKLSFVNGFYRLEANSDKVNMGTDVEKVLETALTTIMIRYSENNYFPFLESLSLDLESNEKAPPKKKAKL